MGIRCKVLVGLAVLISTFSLFAFSWALEQKTPREQAIRQEVEQEALEEAQRAFDAGDYKKAKIGFEMLSENAQTPEIHRQALFALASVKLALAGGSQEYEDAIATWKEWSDISRSSAKCEDPIMITPLLLRLKESLKSFNAGLSDMHGRRAAKDVDFKGLRQTKEREMRALRTKLALREREVRRLRHQLESLEEIHRKYEEKKLEVTP